MVVAECLSNGFFSVDCLPKVPFEKLIIGRRGGNQPTPQTDEQLGVKSIPSRFLMCSVVGPRAHSRKPLLLSLLKPFLPANALYLELFARCLVKGGTAWGNQVLKFQDTKLFAQLS